MEVTAYMTETLLTFAGNHWTLLLLFFVILVLLVQEEIKHASGPSAALSPGELVHWMNHKNALVVDLRPQVAYSEQHIIHSIHIPEAAFLSIFGVDAPTKEPSIPPDILQSIRQQQKKGRPVVLVCASGNASLGIAKKLTRHSVEHIYALLGGIDAWKEEHFPLAKEETS